MTLLRSFLFVPGDAMLRFPKALASGADAIIQDLEDSVPTARKEEARRLTAASLAESAESVRRFVRVNAQETPYCWDDLHAVVVPGLNGIVVPKAEDPAALAAVTWVVSELERTRGMIPGGVEILPLIESAAGIQAVEVIARATPRIRRLTFGAVDLSTELGFEVDAMESQLAPLRWRLAVASRAAGLDPPIDTVFLRIKDEGGLSAVVRLAKSFGFHGKLCIHPSQVAVVNGGFMPSEEEITQARRILDAVGVDADAAAAASVDGMMVDRPVVDRALRILRSVDGENTKPI
ncbi:MAG: HpcH/HpaI aldolase/citrate lyase family protein [Nitrospira sp.]